MVWRGMHMFPSARWMWTLHLWLCCSQVCRSCLWALPNSDLCNPTHTYQSFLETRDTVRNTFKFQSALQLLIMPRCVFQPNQDHLKFLWFRTLTNRGKIIQDFWNTNKYVFSHFTWMTIMNILYLIISIYH